MTIKKKKVSAHMFRRVQDEILGVDNLDMARLLGLKLNNRSNAIRSIDRMRNGQKDVSGTAATVLWFILDAEDLPPWIHDDLANRVLDAAEEARSLPLKRKKARPSN